MDIKKMELRASNIRKGDCVLLKSKPCKIVDITTTKGRNVNVQFVGIDIFTGKKYLEICASNDIMSKVVVTKTKYRIMDINYKTGHLQLSDEKNRACPDIKLSPLRFCSDESWVSVIYKSFQILEDNQKLFIIVIEARGQRRITGYEIYTEKPLLDLCCA